MIFVYSFQDLNEFQLFLRLANGPVIERDEQFHYCLSRERATEILKLREMEIPYVVIASGPLKKHSILDKNFDLDVLDSTMKVVLRTMNDIVLPAQLKRLGLAFDDAYSQTILHWPRTIRNQEKYLKRSVMELSHGEFSRAFLAGEIGAPCFIKSVEKSELRTLFKCKEEMESVLRRAEDVDKLGVTHLVNRQGLKPDDIVHCVQARDWYCPYREMMVKGDVYTFSPKEGVILSEPLVIEYEGPHKREYRTFVVNHSVSSISAYVDYDSLNIPDEIRAMAEAFVADNTHLPPHYVVDFGMSDRGPVLIELNHLHLSGRFLDNDPVALFTDLTQGIDYRRIMFHEPTVDAARPEGFAEQVLGNRRKMEADFQNEMGLMDEMEQQYLIRNAESVEQQEIPTIKFHAPSLKKEPIENSPEI